MNSADAGPSDPDAAQASAAGTSAQGRAGMWLALAVFIYGVGYLIWYLGTPLGRAPQLDGAENLVLAAQIAHGTLAHEPFYRAMLYPAVLALPLLLGCPMEWLPALASIFGLFCHFAVTLAVARLAAQLWRGKNARSASLLAAALWGLNPVALFYAVDVLDVTPALALFLWGIVLLARPNGRMRAALAGGALLALAVAARPNFMPVVIIAPLARAWLAGRWRFKMSDALTWAGAAMPLLLLGGIQMLWAGQFRILPWQGAFNFYAANRAGANGRYFAQQEVFTEIAPGENPARMESELLYEQQTKTAPPLDIAQMDAYWNTQARAAIMDYPGRWLRLLARKTYYLLNDFDQYNNKTYAWHRAQSPWLWWNFLGWGILFVLAAGMLPVGWARDATVEKMRSAAGIPAAVAWGTRSAGVPPAAVGVTLAASFPKGLGGTPNPATGTVALHETMDSSRAMLAGMVLIFCAYAAGVLLYYASGRFRLPLMPLLCVLAGGWTILISERRSPPKIVLAAGAAMLFAAALTFSNFFAAHDESTFVQDELLSANAAIVVGEDAQAYALAETVLAGDATQPTAREIAVVSYYNLSLAGQPGTDSLTGWSKQLARLESLKLHNSPLVLVAGMALWKTGSQANAMTIWQSGATHFGPDSAPAQALAAAKFLQGNAQPNSAPPDPAMVKYLQKTPVADRE